ncbi:DNA primase small subunit [Phlebotomus argentipes]|uniref:DNA primase small subunit n=1 Tax=Phlebotomus argentipes TaxID=94469 RepID=UPI002892C4EA|nr:DNA primase small subunit [Phlebotomus argentipes]
MSLASVNTQMNSEVLPEHLKMYYKRLFPYKQFYQWLSYDDEKLFQHREFCFTYDGDVFQRYLTFDDQEHMAKEMTAKVPSKIDIGPVMNVRPNKLGLAQNLRFRQRELIFDIDMTDYDEIRTCCSGAAICHKCWKFMSVACDILGAALREDFGFENILWVFSGRRGIHCWISDHNARELTGEVRSAVVQYLNLVGRNETSGRYDIECDYMHPRVQRTLATINAVFEEICLQDQDLFNNADNIQKFILSRIHNETIRNELKLKLLGLPNNSKIVWQTFEGYMNAVKGKNPRLKYLVDDLKIFLTYPRLDINVTNTMNHLLKAPFCVHPKTGKVCVPFTPGMTANFDPASVPTIMDLCKEIDAYDAKKAEDAEKFDVEVGNIQTYKKTSLHKAVHIFEEFIRKCGKRAEKRKDTMDF